MWSCAAGLFGIDGDREEEEEGKVQGCCVHAARSCKCRGEMLKEGPVEGGSM
jgi:hypothetical protein